MTNVLTKTRLQRKIMSLLNNDDTFDDLDGDLLASLFNLVLYSGHKILERTISSGIYVTKHETRNRCYSPPPDVFLGIAASRRWHLVSAGRVVVSWVDARRRQTVVAVHMAAFEQPWGVLFHALHLFPHPSYLVLGHALPRYVQIAGGASTLKHGQSTRVYEDGRSVQEGKTSAPGMNSRG